MFDAAYHRAWRAKAKEDPDWVEHRQKTHRAYIQHRKMQDPKWYEKRKIAKRVPNPKKPWANHISLTPEQTRVNRQIYYQRIKREVLTKYGGVCSCCGENDTDLLSIDHIDNGRPEGRKLGGINLYQKLRRINFPAGYRVLCLNCNLALGFYGYCPHKGVPNKLLNIQERYNKKLKIEIINKYGGKCVHCGESTFEFLTIDHIDGCGREKRMPGFYTYLRKIEKSNDYQILCCNCNWVKWSKFRNIKK